MVTSLIPVSFEEGNTWVTFKDDVYELHSFIEGGDYERQNVRKLASAGRAIALYHKALGDFEDPEEKSLPRYDNLREVLAFLKKLETSLNQDDQVLETKLKAIPHTIIHGDYHPDNVKFNGDEVCGIFDLDWASLQPRIRDIVDDVLYFAADRKSDIHGGNIYSLTQPCRISVEKSRIFVTAYCEEGELLQDEIRYIPWFIRMRWIYSKYSGTKKVPYEQLVLFF